MIRLNRTEVFLLVIDVQEKLLPVIDQRESLVQNIERLIRGAGVLDVPVLTTEQYVKGLGRSVEPIRTALAQTAAQSPIEKVAFSAWGSAEFQTELRLLHRKHAVVAGIEAHVCVYQTVADLLKNGFGVTVVDDAVSSRTPRNQQIGVRRMLQEGALLTSTEMVLFELAGTSGTDEFRAISRLVK
ncbi:MAG: hydrolase [Thermoanaerobaculia bacterium]